MAAPGIEADFDYEVRESKEKKTGRIWYVPYVVFEGDDAELFDEVMDELGRNPVHRWKHNQLTGLAGNLDALIERRILNGTAEDFEHIKMLAECRGKARRAAWKCKKRWTKLNHGDTIDPWHMKQIENAGV